MIHKQTRQQIYERIGNTFDEKEILKEMNLLGFWETTVLPSFSEEVLSLEKALTTRLNEETKEVFKNYSAYHTRSDILSEDARNNHIKKQQNHQVQNRKEKIKKQLEKTARWKLLQQEDIFYLGEEVSAGLCHKDTREELLRKHGLPIFGSLKELSEAMGESLPDLCYLIYNRKVSRECHYYAFEIPKRSGGMRRISAPKQRLKSLQMWVLKNILSCLSTDEYVHGFVAGRSILTNATPHTGQDMVINVDLKDFFPSISYERVKGLFHRLGYSEQTATILALICTYAETRKVKAGNRVYYVQKGKRCLPQGSPASPAISNLIAYRLDKRLKGMADKYGFTYTRYADDLTFSGSYENGKYLPAFMHYLKEVVHLEGFVLHPEKTHIMRKGRRQKVTGIVVNDKPNVERNRLRTFRALLHNIEYKGWKDQQWGHSDNLLTAIEGYIHFVSMVNPEKAAKFREQLQRILSKQGLPPEKAPRTQDQGVDPGSIQMTENRDNETDTTTYLPTTERHV